MGEVFKNDTITIKEINDMWERIHNATDYELMKMEIQNHNSILLSKSSKLKPMNPINNN